ncbi:3'-5' exonuclease [Paracidovorax avenae]|uniref:3'-5' exonuclease n=1 Tax=Paracidovorax avenae TaxID=80867 RepID=UPI000D20964D|nr:3'-5' exonuclease [Paracidovorax avenae]AVS68162.1 3'-5' exonuclease [Paracidovorax avenae]
MNLALFYDTETTGIPLYSQPSEDPAQPHIVQLAAVLVDLDTRREVASMDVVVRPDGWTIPDDVAQLHGITTETAARVGVPEPVAVDMLLALWNQRARIGHNESFDARILRIAIKRYIDPRAPGAEVAMSDLWKAGARQCTQATATPLLTEHRKARGMKGKTASLAEAHELLCGGPVEGAHSAMGDVRACMRVYFAMRHPVSASVGGGAS